MQWLHPWGFFYLWEFPFRITQIWCHKQFMRHFVIHFRHLIVSSTVILEMISSLLLLLGWWVIQAFLLASVTHCTKIGFTIRISPVNVTKCAGNYGYGHIYWRNPLYKTALFVFLRYALFLQCIKHYICSFLRCFVILRKVYCYLL